MVYLLVVCYCKDSKKYFKSFQLDVGMSSIQAYKTHKQEGTIAVTTLVSKVHKQGASLNSQTSVRQWLHCMSNNLAVLFQFVVTLN